MIQLYHSMAQNLVIPSDFFVIEQFQLSIVKPKTIISYQLDHLACVFTRDVYLGFVFTLLK